MKKIYKRKRRSFAGRLTWQIVLVLLFTMGLTSWLIAVFSMSFMEGETTEKYQGHLENSKENIRRVLSDVYVASLNNVPVIEENLDNPHEVERILQRMVTLNPQIRGVGISYVRDFLPKRKNGYQPYSFRTHSGLIVTRDYATEAPGYLTQQWFLNALRAEKGYWSEPFFEKNDSLTPLVSYILPLHDRQGRTVAVMGTDLSLHWMRHMLNQFDEDIYQTVWKFSIEKDSLFDKERQKRRFTKRRTTTFAVTRNGTFVVHPDSMQVLHGNILDIVKATPDTKDDQLASYMLKGLNSREIPDSFKSDNTEILIDGREYAILFTPIPHVDWALGIAVPSYAIEFMSIVMVVMFAFLIIIALTVLYFMCRSTIRRAAKPLEKLASTANEVAKGHFDTVLPAVKYNDEIRLLRDSFEEMQQSLTLYVDELKMTTAAKVAIDSELKIAHDIQMSMLPKMFPPFPERDDIDVFGTLTPAKGIGGDLFDFYIRDEKLFFCIGDVSGKGVPAALVMATTRSLFRNVSYHQSDPSKIVTALNIAQSDHNDTNMFVTLFVGVLQLRTGILYYCNAGHDAPLLLNSKFGTLPCDSNLPIGVMEDWKYSQQRLTLEPQTTIFLFTDGLTEAENTDHQLFGIERVQAVAEAAWTNGQHQPTPFIERMTQAVHGFVGNAEQSDDLTMLAIELIRTEDKTTS